MTYKELADRFNLLRDELGKLPRLPDDPKRLHINAVANEFAAYLSAGARHEKFLSDVRDHVRFNWKESSE